VVGNFELAVEMRQVRLDGTRRTIGRGSSIPLEFKEKLSTAGSAFRMKNVPLPGPGLYEYRVTAKGGYDDRLASVAFTRAAHGQSLAPALSNLLRHLWGRPRVCLPRVLHLQRSPHAIG
jgi:hypothetical protein